MKTNEDFISVTDASKLLRVTERTVLNYLKKQRLEGRKQEGRWLVTRASVAALVHEIDSVGRSTSIISRYPRVFNEKNEHEPGEERREKAGERKKGGKLSNMRTFRKLMSLGKSIYNAASNRDLPEPLRQRILNCYLNSVEHLSAGFNSYKTAAKLGRYQRSREEISACCGYFLFLSEVSETFGNIPKDSESFGNVPKDSEISRNSMNIANTIEKDVIPSFNGLIRKIEGMEKR